MLDLSKNEQKAPDLFAVRPDGRIPGIVDHDEDDFAVFESGAILSYLAEKTGRLLPPDAKGRSRETETLRRRNSPERRAAWSRLARA